MAARIVAVIGLTLMLAPDLAFARSRCDEDGAHAAALAGAESEVRARCDCAAAPTHASHVDCARAIARELVDAGDLPKACAGRVRQFARRSTCGRDGVVACCLQGRKGKWRGVVRDSDDACLFLHTCNGVIEPGEECDGQAGCGPACALARVACCDFGGACIGNTVYDDFSAYFNVFKPCVQVLFGQGSFGVCEGPPCPEAPELCRIGSCADHPIDPLPLCCNQAAGGCRDTVATTAGAIGGFGCSTFPPPEEGDIDRLVLGTCGDEGRCEPLE